MSSISQKVVQNLVKQSKSKNLKVKVLTLQCLATLSNTLQSEIDKYFNIILPVIQGCMADKQNYDPIIDSLRILRSLFRHTEPGAAAQFR